MEDEEDEGEDEDAVKERIRKLVSGEAAGVVLDDDDEEIESDDAFEGEAEFGEAFMKKKTGAKKRSVHKVGTLLLFLLFLHSKLRIAFFPLSV